MNIEEIKSLLIQRSTKIRFSKPSTRRNPIDNRANRLAIIKDETIQITGLITIEADKIAVEHNMESNAHFKKKLCPTIQSILKEKVHSFLSNSSHNQLPILSAPAKSNISIN